MFLGQNVFEDAALANPIRRSNMFLCASAFNGSTLGQLIHLNDMSLHQLAFKGSAAETYKLHTQRGLCLNCSQRWCKRNVYKACTVAQERIGYAGDQQ
jgi:hypothetical protein